MLQSETRTNLFGNLYFHKLLKHCRLFRCQLMVLNAERRLKQEKMLVFSSKYISEISNERQYVYLYIRCINTHIFYVHLYVLYMHLCNFGEKTLERNKENHLLFILPK